MGNDFKNINLRSINAKILNVERIYGKDSKITQRIYETINRAYKTQGMTRFRKLNRTASFSDEIRIINAYEHIINSPFTSQEGRRQMAENWRTSFNSARGWSDSRIARAQDIFNNSINWSRFRELAGKFGSDRAITILTDEDNGESNVKALDEYFDAYTASTKHDESQVTDDLINYILSDEKGRKKIIRQLRKLAK